MFMHLEILMFFVDFFLQFLAVILSLTTTLSLDFNLMAQLRIFLGQVTSFVFEICDSLRFLTA
jgi:hypothetical protein